MFVSVRSRRVERSCTAGHNLLAGTRKDALVGGMTWMLTNMCPAVTSVPTFRLAHMRGRFPRSSGRHFSFYTKLLQQAEYVRIGKSVPLVYHSRAYARQHSRGAHAMKRTRVEEQRKLEDTWGRKKPSIVEVSNVSTCEGVDCQLTGVRWRVAMRMTISCYAVVDDSMG